ncbi:MAG: sulfatase-like hydrolase/transferase [Actinobacteria bacterium]|nr:sulfatase-like hydrolase/transferase [Actinomycetota bacterium]
MGRKILFITTDQMRYDAIGANGGRVARTPNIDSFAADGISYDRAQPQNVVCMPSRSTMVTGQNIGTHGVWMNGVPLPVDSPSVAAVLRDAGYRTALIGKSHFEPLLDPFLRFEENQQGFAGATEGHRGFDHMELATHGAAGFTHYSRWIRQNHPEAIGMFFQVLDGDLEVSNVPGGDSGAPQIKHNAVPRDWYHTDWVADRTISWLDGLHSDDDWFCWMSFPDPHHPWDPPESELHRVDWRELDLPVGYPQNQAQREAIIDAKPRHWRLWYDGKLVSNYEAPGKWVPATLTADQIREVNAMAHIENELIDEAIGRVLAAIEAKGWSDDLDIVFTTDHGEFQGDFGFLFKGPYHVDSLMRIPLIWRPAPSAGGGADATARVSKPVGLLDLAPTFCSIAGVQPPEWMEGRPLPIDDADAAARGFERVTTEWDSRQPDGTEIHLRTIMRDDFVCTTYQPGTVHDGTEGELYDLVLDPLQQINLWDDPERRSLRDELLIDLAANFVEPIEFRHAEAPV